MKFSLSWLKEHLDTDEPLEKLADKLTMIGLEVEHIEDKAKALAPFTIARVISAEQHPNADRLRVCMVDTGAKNEQGLGTPVQVVCGAPNARAGLVSVFSAPGTFIPGKNFLAAGKGKQDFKSIVAAADPAVLKWVTVELDSCDTDMTQAVIDSYSYLVGNGLARGNK